MFKTNEYFDGIVKSIAFNTDKGDATIGVMAVANMNLTPQLLNILQHLAI